MLVEPHPPTQSPGWNVITPDIPCLATHAVRRAAKNVVAAVPAEKVEVQMANAIGPLSVLWDAPGTEQLSPIGLANGCVR